jgi:hypothetical protein
MELSAFANISKEEFFTCKLTGKSFTDSGNFGKHLKKLGVDYVAYCHEFYYDFIPKCLVTGLPSDVPLRGYFMKWSLFSKKYKGLRRKIAANLTKLNKIPDVYKSEFITYEYWINVRGYSVSDAYEKIHFLTSSGLYKRLTKNYFDSTWTSAGIEKYKNDILDGNDIKIKTLFSTEGWLQRGWDVDNAEVLKAKYIEDNLKTQYKQSFWLDKGYSHEEATNKISEIQKENSNKLHNKYTKSQFRKFSHRCIEYWIERGYSEEDAKLAVSAVQTTFSLDKCIMKHGLKIGAQIFEERQLRWQESLITNNDMDEVNSRKGKDLFERIKLYGELPAKKWFAKRYWKTDINTLEEFAECEQFILQGYTRKFYNRTYRKAILETQQYKCGNPTCIKLHTDEVFDLHHIDYDKTNDARMNLIFLCKPCHSRTSNAKDRQYWINFYSHINEVFCAKTI